MKTAGTLLLLLGLAEIAGAQEVTELPYESAPGVAWENEERRYFSEIWNTPVVTNVSVPTMRIFRPPEGTANGTALVVAPGGGFYALSIESEGNLVAEWLARKGITAFVLRYRLVPTGEDGVREVSEAGDRFADTVAPIIPLATADGLNAVSYVRENASQYGIDPGKIGFMGFSAGGTVTMGVTLNYTPDNRPDFIVPVYPWVSAFQDYTIPDDAPPMLIICATDDGLGLARESIDLYSAWHSAGVSAALHMFARGDHGFGMRQQDLPSDNWIVRFYEWALAEGFTTAPVRSSTSTRGRTGHSLIR